MMLLATCFLHVSLTAMSNKSMVPAYSGDLLQPVIKRIFSEHKLGQNLQI